MNTDRKEELILLGELKNAVLGLGDRIETLGSGLHSRIGRAEEAHTDLANKREQDNKTLNERLLGMDKQIVKNMVIGTAISAGASAIIIAVFVALVQKGVL